MTRQYTFNSIWGLLIFLFYGVGIALAQYNGTVNSNNALAIPPPPQFTYTIPDIYTVGTPITPLSPNNTGGAVPATIFGSVSTFAGDDNLAGYNDATGANALFTSLWGIDIDASGNLYVSDNKRIRKITPGAVVTTLAGGNPINDVSDGTGAAAGFSLTAGLSVAPSGNIFVGDINNKSIRQITPAGTVTTFAGTGNNNFDPAGVATDPLGNVFVADEANDLIWQIPASGSAAIYAGQQNGIGSANGPALSAAFNNPADLQFDGSGNLYVADKGNNMIREISTAGIVSTVAGTISPGLQNGPIATARFSNPLALALDAANNIYVSDAQGLVMRLIDARGVVVSIAGNNVNQASRDGIGAEATFTKVSGLVYTNGVLFAADKTCVRKIIVTGYSIDKPLPTGLVFDSATGVISGTPAVTSPATQYTITGYNTGGSYSTIVTITVNAPVTIPPAITYPTPQVYTVNTPIAPLMPTNSGGPVSSINNTPGFVVDQPLPAGLILDPVSGIISGTPTVVSPATDYQITAGNPGGTSTFTINITVKPLPVEIIAFGPIPVKTYGNPDFASGATSNDSGIPITYTSDNTSVATIVNGKIHITGAGMANITASQPGDNNYSAAASVGEPLTVKKAPLIIKADDQTRYFGRPNPAFAATYTGFVYGDTPAQLTTPPVIATSAVETSAIGTYAITVTGATSNNYDIQQISGTLTIIPVPPTITIPNAFTPNGDGFNDLWNIKSIDAYPQCLVSVYNRYGSLIYQSRGYARSWDGTYNGSPLPTGTYYYIIDLKNGTPPLSGYVALIR